MNQTSLVGSSLLVDTLLYYHVKIKTLFAPEHGIRGNVSAGELFDNTKDKKTGLPIISLYGKNKKPQAEQLKNIDVLVFDLQDVGVRFYTYISTLHYVMEAAAEAGIPCIVLDRPNPNGYYLDGPVLKKEFTSFVGMHPVPVVYGMTIGEYAHMINGERWLANGVQCALTVIPCIGYTHADRYHLPVRPSPNLPNDDAIALYPSLCLFEGTPYSIGRGTDWPFQCVGKPEMTEGDFTFTPINLPGIASHPPQENKTCRGYRLTNYVQTVHAMQPQMNIGFILSLYQEDTAKASFFTPFFDTLAGTDALRKAIQEGKSEQEIRKSWKADLIAFMRIRDRYLLYPDTVHRFYE